MSEMGNLDIGAPGEGVASGNEALSEEAKQRFAGAAQAVRLIRKEEKKSRKRDDKVAQIIVQFLGQQQYTHLFLLISRLVARDCPSIFILALLSLIHEASKAEVAEYMQDHPKQTAACILTKIPAPGNLTVGNEQSDGQTNQLLLEWITRLQFVLSLSPQEILLKLMVDDRNIDGTVLQLSSFILQEFFTAQGRTVPFEKLQPLTAGILQSVFEPFIPAARKALLEQRKTNEATEE